MNASLLQLLLSLGEVALMVGVCAVLFGRRPRTLDSESVAGQLAREVAGFRAGALALSADGHSALAQDGASARVYLVVQNGDGMVTRELKRGLRADAQADGNRLSLRLRDFTLRRVELALPDAKAWQARLGELS